MLQNSIKTLPAVICVMVGAVPHLAISAPSGSMGPSALAAAKLKKAPPPGWIRHYLPDDRYKVAGRVWKWVSTENDRYFHKPSCPHILKQPADGVIGFASADDAREAGYQSDPDCASNAAYERSWIRESMTQNNASGPKSSGMLPAVTANPEHESGFDWMVPKRSAASIARERKWAENRLRAQIMSRQTITGSSAFGSSTSTTSGSFRP